MSDNVFNPKKIKLQAIELGYWLKTLDEDTQLVVKRTSDGSVWLHEPNSNTLCFAAEGSGLDKKGDSDE